MGIKELPQPSVFIAEGKPYAAALINDYNVGKDFLYIINLLTGTAVKSKGIGHLHTSVAPKIIESGDTKYALVDSHLFQVYGELYRSKKK